MKASRAASLSTGEAANKLAVTPDTVLKWIKQGRIPAHRTAGGHHRIEFSVVERLMASGCALGEDGCAVAAPSRCWEFFSVGGAIRQECTECSAYRVRAALCYELSRLEPPPANRKVFCQTACEDCPYYQQVNRLPSRVLVVTADRGLAEALAGISPEAAVVRVVGDTYGASAEIGSFRPSLVVLDSHLPEGVFRELAGAVTADRRVPWVQVAVIEGGSEPAALGGFAVLSRSILSGQIEALLSERHVEAASAQAGEPSA